MSTSPKSASKRLHNCPQCGKPMVWDKSNPFRPFCSERCKMIDLGQWASEAYRFPADVNQSSSSDDKPDE